MKHYWPKSFKRCALSVLIFGAGSFAVVAAPSPEIAKKCYRYAYIAYPFKRPGSAPGSPARQIYFKDCLEKEGDVPAPPPPSKP